MSIKHIVTDFSLKHYKLVTWVMVVSTLVLAVFLPKMTIDTDPENMLSGDNPVRCKKSSAT